MSSLDSNFEKPKRPEYHLKQLRHLLNDFSDTIPPIEMHGSEGSQYKVKMNQWQSLLDTLDLANMEAVHDSGLQAEIEAFVNKYSNSGMTRRGTQKEDIDAVNALLKKVIEYLEGRVIIIL